MVLEQFRIGVTGSRNWKLYGPVERALRWHAYEAHLKGLQPVLVNGKCPTGADYISSRIWRSWKWEPEEYTADWDNCDHNCPKDQGRHRFVKKPNDKHHPGLLDTYCPKAGPRRNRMMIGLGMDVLLAFPMNGPMRGGTWQCINAALGAGVEVQYPSRWQ